MEILGSILETIGDTPLVRLNRVALGLEASVLAKCEYLNPSGSIKDRIALRMIEEATKSGQLKPGWTLHGCHHSARQPLQIFRLRTFHHIMKRR